VVKTRNEQLVEQLGFVLSILQRNLYNETTVVPSSTYLVLTELKQIKGVMEGVMPIEMLTPLTFLSEQVDCQDVSDQKFQEKKNFRSKW